MRFHNFIKRNASEFENFLIDFLSLYRSNESIGKESYIMMQHFSIIRNFVIACVYKIPSIFLQTKLNKEKNLISVQSDNEISS